MRRGLAILLGLASLTACNPPGSQASRQASQLRPNLGNLPSGDIAGVSRADAGASINNPLEGQPEAIADGKRLFVQMNCAGCHGYDLGGSMGPNLKDNYWRYGGTAVAIYRSIDSGHPQGMPAWGRALPPDQIWKLVAYIQSYGGATPPTDYRWASQGDQAAKTTSPPGGRGAQSGTKGGAAPAAQSANP